MLLSSVLTINQGTESKNRVNSVLEKQEPNKELNFSVSVLGSFGSVLDFRLNLTSPNSYTGGRLLLSWNTLKQKGMSRTLDWFESC